LAIEISGYLIEEHMAENYEEFKRDVASANISLH